MSQSRTSDFEELKHLGTGSFGTVYKVRRVIDDRVYVMKKILLRGMSAKEQREAIQEVKVMAAIDCPHVVQYYDSFIEDGTLHIIMEYCEKGDLETLLSQLKERESSRKRREQKARKKKDRDGSNDVNDETAEKQKKKNRCMLSENAVWRIFLQMAVGVHYLHSKRILHRDLKSANIFLGIRKDRNSGKKRYDVKVGDLGVARVLSSSTVFAKTIIGTPYYLSPELCEDKPYNEKSDMWALGCLLYELCTLRHPFNANNHGALVLKIIRGKYPPISKRYSKILRDLVASMLNRDPLHRPSVVDILSIPSVNKKAKQLHIQLPEGLPVTVPKKKLSTNVPAAPSASPTKAHNRALGKAKLAVSTDGKTFNLIKGMKVSANRNTRDSFEDTSSSLVLSSPPGMSNRDRQKRREEQDAEERERERLKIRKEKKETEAAAAADLARRKAKERIRERAHERARQRAREKEEEEESRQKQNRERDREWTRNSNHPLRIRNSYEDHHHQKDYSKNEHPTKDTVVALLPRKNTKSSMTQQQQRVRNSNAAANFGKNRRTMNRISSKRSAPFQKVSDDHLLAPFDSTVGTLVLPPETTKSQQLKPKSGNHPVSSSNHPVSSIPEQTKSKTPSAWKEETTVHIRNVEVTHYDEHQPTFAQMFVHDNDLREDEQVEWYVNDNGHQRHTNHRQQQHYQQPNQPNRRYRHHHHGGRDSPLPPPPPPDSPPPPPPPPLDLRVVPPSHDFDIDSKVSEFGDQVAERQIFAREKLYEIDDCEDDFEEEEDEHRELSGTGIKLMKIRGSPEMNSDLENIPPVVDPGLLNSNPKVNAKGNRKLEVMNYSDDHRDHHGHQPRGEVIMSSLSSKGKKGNKFESDGLDSLQERLTTLEGTINRYRKECDSVLGTVVVNKLLQKMESSANGAAMNTNESLWELCSAASRCSNARWEAVLRCHQLFALLGEIEDVRSKLHDSKDNAKSHIEKPFALQQHKLQHNHYRKPSNDARYHQGGDVYRHHPDVAAGYETQGHHHNQHRTDKTVAPSAHFSHHGNYEQHEYQPHGIMNYQYVHK